MKLTQYKLSTLSDTGLIYKVVWLDKDDLNLGDFVNLKSNGLQYKVERKYSTINSNELDVDNKAVIIDSIV